MGKALSDLEQKATSWDLSAQNHLATYSRLVKVSEHRTPDPQNTIAPMKLASGHSWEVPAASSCVHDPDTFRLSFCIQDSVRQPAKRNIQKVSKDNDKINSGCLNVSHAT